MVHGGQRIGVDVMQQGFESARGHLGHGYHYDWPRLGQVVELPAPRLEHEPVRGEGLGSDVEAYVRRRGAPVGVQELGEVVAQQLRY
jgi:hypothetical protein